MGKEEENAALPHPNIQTRSVTMATNQGKFCVADSILDGSRRLQTEQKMLCGFSKRLLTILLQTQTRVWLSAALRSVAYFFFFFFCCLAAAQMDL